MAHWHAMNGEGEVGGDVPTDPKLFYKELLNGLQRMRIEMKDMKDQFAEQSRSHVRSSNEKRRMATYERFNEEDEEGSASVGRRREVGGKRRDGNLNALKMTIPSFKGRKDAETYLEWERNVEKIFSHHHYTEEKKVRLASMAFSDYALIWWNELGRSQKIYGEDPIATWDEMKIVMRKRYAQSHYRKSSQQFHRFPQEYNILEDYPKMEKMIIEEAKNEKNKENGPMMSDCTSEEKKERCAREKKLVSQMGENIVKSEEVEINEIKEAKKEKKQINGPMESENQSEERECFHANSLILAYTNPYLCSGVSLLQEHEDEFGDEITKDLSPLVPSGEKDQVDFMFGETLNFNETKELQKQLQIKEELGFKWEHSSKHTFNPLYSSPILCLSNCFNFDIGSVVFEIDFDVFLKQGQVINFPHWQQIERWKNVVFKPNDWVLEELKILNAKEDGPFQVPKRIRSDAYKISLQGKYNKLHIFKISNSSTVYMVSDSRTNLFEEGGNDTSIGGTSRARIIMESSKELVEETWTNQIVIGPSIVVENVTYLMWTESGANQPILGLETSK